MKCSVYITVTFFAAALANQDDLRRIDSIVQEDPCSRVGGICTVTGDCPEGQLSEKSGLCPQQRTQGVECCHGVSTRETRCNKHGGVCMAPDKFCNPRLVFDSVHDCPDNYKCCIMTL